MTSLDDPALKTMRIGVHLFAADGENTPPAMALSRHGVVGKFDHAVINDLPPFDRLRLFFLNRLRMITDHPGIPQLVFSGQFAKALPPAGARALRGAIRRSVEFLGQAAAEAATRGEVRTDVPSSEVVVLVMGALLARGLLATHAAGQAASPDEAWQRLATVLGPQAHRK